MAEHDVITPLLSNHGLSHPSDEPQVVITVDGDRCSDQQLDDGPTNQNGQTNITQLGIENPFEFLGASEIHVPPSCTIDPFRNHTPKIYGVYEWLKILVCLPIAVLRLLLFGLSILVGYLATKVALHGWKDKQNPMPEWRCRTRGLPGFVLGASSFHLGLGLCTIEELQQVEQQLEQSVRKVRVRKMQVFLKEQLDQLKEKEEALEADNAKLCEKLGLTKEQEPCEERETVASTKSNEDPEVETRLFLGPSQGRTKHAQTHK